MVMQFIPPPLMAAQKKINLAWLSAGIAETTATTKTVSGLGIGVPSSDRLVVAVIYSANVNSGASVSPISITIGGVPASIVASGSGTNVSILLCQALIPVGTTADVVGTYPSGAARMVASLYAVTGYSTADPFSIDAPSGGGAASRTASINVPVNAVAIGAANYSSTNAPFTGSLSLTSLDYAGNYAGVFFKSASSSPAISGSALSVTDTCRCIITAAWR